MGCTMDFLMRQGVAVLIIAFTDRVGRELDY
jgi:hypothetical protein